MTRVILGQRRSFASERQHINRQAFATETVFSVWNKLNLQIQHYVLQLQRDVAGQMLRALPALQHRHDVLTLVTHKDMPTTKHTVILAATTVRMNTALSAAGRSPPEQVVRRVHTTFTSTLLLSSLYSLPN